MFYSIAMLFLGIFLGAILGITFFPNILKSSLEKMERENPEKYNLKMKELLLAFKDSLEASGAKIEKTDNGYTITLK